jgi:hypothetical protein
MLATTSARPCATHFPSTFARQSGGTARLVAPLARIPYLSVGWTLGDLNVVYRQLHSYYQ